MRLVAGQSIVVTGGTGSFGYAFVRYLLGLNPGPARICILSRDEYKQGVMRAAFRDDPRLRWFLGDVRDAYRLKLAFQGAAVVVHAAAMKQVPACEYNVDECIATNILGARNVVMAALECKVPRVLALSTDKASNPVTTYGASKLMLERVIINGNSLAHDGVPRFACTRYGNVQGSRLSVVPVWREAMAQGEPLLVTDPESTRFQMTQDQAVQLVCLALEQMEGGEIFVPKLDAYLLGDLLTAVVAGVSARVEIIGLRGGEKLHESLIGPDEVRHTRDHGDHYRILPSHHPWHNGGINPGGELLPDGFVYRSDTVRRLSVDELQGALAGV